MQCYGPPIVDCLIVNKATGQLDVVHFLWPVADVRRANELRRWAGFPTSVAQNARLQRLSAAPLPLGLRSDNNISNDETPNTASLLRFS